MWVVGGYSSTVLTLDDIVLPKPDIDFNLYVARANFLDKKPVMGINSLRKTLNIYPNPTNNLLNIEFPSDRGEPYSLKLFSLQGQLMDEFIFLKNTVLNLSKYESGLYMLVFNNGKETETHKISIQH